MAVGSRALWLLLLGRTGRLRSAPNAKAMGALVGVTIVALMARDGHAAACCVSATSFGVGRLLIWEDLAVGLQMGHARLDDRRVEDHRQRSTRRRGHWHACIHHEFLDLGKGPIMRIQFVFPLLGVLVIATLCAPSVYAKGSTTAKAAEAKGGKTEKTTEAKAPQVVEISVTKEGFVPKEVKVKAGQPVKLLVTRKIDKTCAREIVIKDYGINEPLPLDKTVTIILTPSKTGPTRFACSMDMIAGVIVAE